MRSDDLTRSEARVLQGAAILMMFAHHLFGLPSLIHPPAGYWPTIPGLPLDAWIGRAGKACVGIFLFLSGYGLMRAGLQPAAAYARRALRFWAMYLPYALLAWVVGRLWFADLTQGPGPRFPTDLWRLVANLATLRNDFAYEWWFAETYLALLLLAPLTLRLARRPGPALALSLAAFAAGAWLDRSGLRFPLLSVPNLLIWQLPFLQGAVIAALPGRTLPPRASAAAALALLAAFALTEALRPEGLTPVLILSTPLWVLVLRAALAQGGPRLQGALAALGRLSLPLWLVHPLLCYAFAQPLVYAPRYAPLVLAWLVLLSLAVALPVEALRKALRPG